MALGRLLGLDRDPARDLPADRRPASPRGPAALAADWLARPAAHLFDQGQALETRPPVRRTHMARGVCHEPRRLDAAGNRILGPRRCGWERPFSLAAGRACLCHVIEPGRSGARARRRAGRRRAAAGRAAGRGLGGAAAAVSVFGIRLATVGVSTPLGVVFLLVHVRTARPRRVGAFRRHCRRLRRADSRSRRAALLVKKTELMRDVIERACRPRGGASTSDADRAAYVGADARAGLRRRRHRRVGRAGRARRRETSAGRAAIRVGSVLSIPAAGSRTTSSTSSTCCTTSLPSRSSSARSPS